MKIVKRKFIPHWDTVGNITRGHVIEMKAPVNEYCKKADLYLVGEIPGCYLRDAKGEEYTSWTLQDKIAVTNLRTGGISLVQRSRECKFRPNARVVED